MSREIERRRDPSTSSRPDVACITHMDVKMDIDFERQVISGHVDLAILNLDKDNDKIFLDIKDLDIIRVNGEEGHSLPYVITDCNVDYMGSVMEITLPKSVSETSISVFYSTRPSTSALQWLTPEQTSGKKYPFLFSQCQAIHARSLLPCQDTPSVKFTFNAEVTVPMGLTALMGALRVGSTSNEEERKSTFVFRQPVVVPSYLFALAVGDLKSRKIGPRSTIWGEQELIELAANECSQTETFLVLAEKFCGSYVWGIYDILVLPPSFPFGGMENPCLTFLTPTLLCGDLSNTNVVAHEIAHSWAGNLVTISSFNHFWLNEGFTIFIERKIIGSVFNEATRHFHTRMGLKELEQCISVMGAENPLTKLVVDLHEVNPDDAFSTCPYEKGHTFLMYLENLVGGSEIFEQFILAYFRHFSFKSLDSYDFKDFFLKYFNNKPELQEIDWDSWFFSVGMPPEIPSLDSSLEEECNSLANKWVEWDGKPPGPFSSRDLRRFTSLQVQSFLTTLLDTAQINATKLEFMDEIYHFGQDGNAEIKFRWLRLCIKGRWVEKLGDVFRFAASTGRMKFIRPIYRDLYDWEHVRDDAIKHFLHTKNSYMHVTVHGLMKDLHLSD